MVQITEYERLGDLDSPFELTSKAERAQKQSERIRDAVTCKTPSLTWDQFVAGDPCPGCGRPYVDDAHWEFKGTIHLSDDERARYESEQVRFKQNHGECQAGRHSTSGSLTGHCSKCCPWPPLSPEQKEKLARILGSPTPPHELMKWRLRLFCGHVVERAAHYTHNTVQAAFTGSASCPECGLNPATIIDAEAIGLLGEPLRTPRTGTLAAKTAGTGKLTRAALEARVRELEAEVQRLMEG